MRKYIELPKDVRAALISKYGVTRKAIWEACNFISNGKRPSNIRKDALAMGGLYREENFVPTCTIEHTADGFIQRFAAGVVLTFINSTAVITKNGVEKARYESVTLDGWGSVCKQAQTLAETGMLEMAS